MLPQGDARAVERARDERTPDLSRFARRSTPLPLVYEMGGGGPERRLVCGFLGCDERPFNLLLTALPPVIHLSAAGDDTTTGWLGILLNIAVKESGSDQRARRTSWRALSELMFVGRSAATSRPPARPDGLAGRIARSHGRTGAGRAARRAEAALDGRRAGAARGRLMVPSCRAVHEVVGQPRCNTSPSGACSSRRVCCWMAARWPRSRSAVGYSRRRRSAAFKKLVGQAPATWAQSGGA